MPKQTSGARKPEQEEYNRLRDCYARIDKQTALIDKMRTALAPFAFTADCYPDAIDGLNIGAGLTVGYLRKARSALDEAERFLLGRLG